MNETSQLQSGSFVIRNVLRLLSEVDWWLVLATSFLVVVGLTTLKYSSQGGDFYDKQLDFIWVGVIALLVFWRIPYFFWTHKFVVPILYFINLGLLLAVMKYGHAALGAQRWLAVGPIKMQPSEVAKLIVIFALSAWLKYRPIRRFSDTLFVLALIAPPMFLVFKQPDLGTSLTFGAMFLGMSFWAGATLADIAVLLSPAVSLILHALNQTWWLGFISVFGLTLAIFWRRKNWNAFIRCGLALVVVLANIGVGEARPYLWGMLKEYQQKRLTTFINPYEDPRGSGYHILQSLIAIGAGGVEGAGLGKGNQSQGAFIPERHTDFIFAVVSEEMGFRVAALVVLAYGIICIRALLIAYQSREETAGSVMAIGIMSMFLFHVFLNVGMTMGIMPVAGVPLPFLSYGGTALIVDLIAIGLLQSIRKLNPPPKKDVWL